MALPRGIRAVAAITLCIFFWLVLQIFRAPASIDAPGDKSADWAHDPSSDRTYGSARTKLDLFLTSFRCVQ